MAPILKSVPHWKAIVLTKWTFIGSFPKKENVTCMEEKYKAGDQDWILCGSHGLHSETANTSQQNKYLA